MIAMSVLGFAHDDTSDSLVLVLREMDGETVLPIWIGQSEALSISAALRDEALPRPLSHDLLLRAVEGLGGKVTGMSIVALREGTFYAMLDVLAASLSVDEPPRLLQLDCRPSDGVAVALRAQAPILVDETVLAAASQERRNSRRPGDMPEHMLPAEPPKVRIREGKDTEEGRLAELLQSLEPVSKRVM